MKNALFDLSSRTALLLGSSRGIGKLLALYPSDTVESAKRWAPLQAPLSMQSFEGAPASDFVNGHTL